MEQRPAENLFRSRKPLWFAGVSPAVVFSRKGRKERKEMKDGNEDSEANEVTLLLEPR